MWLLQTSLFVLGFLLSIYVSITIFVLVITEKKNSLARLVMWGRTLNPTGGGGGMGASYYGHTGHTGAIYA